MILSLRTPEDRLLQIIRTERKFIRSGESEERMILFQRGLIHPYNSDVDSDVLDLLFGREVVR